MIIKEEKYYGMRNKYHMFRVPILPVRGVTNGKIAKSQRYESYVCNFLLFCLFAQDTRS
jgi:hypothetical protein